MKFKDYTRLGKISIKSRKKSTRHTVVGIVFGLVMLIPVIFLSLSFKLDLTAAINEKKSISTIVVNSTQTGSVYTDRDTRLVSNININTAIKANDELIEQVIKSENYKLDPQAFIGLDNLDSIPLFNYSNPNEQNQNFIIKAVDLENGNDVIADSYKEDLKKNNKKFLLAGETLTKDSKGEVLISEEIAKKLSPDVNGLIGHKFSINGPLKGDYNYKLSFGSEEFNKPNVKIMSKFTIKGIISNDYYKFDDRNKSDAQIFVNMKSIHDKKTYIPSSKISEEEDGSGHKDKRCNVDYNNFDELQLSAVEDNQIFVALPLLKFIPSGSSFYGNYYEPIYSYTVSLNEYNDAVIFEDYINNQYKTIFNLSDNDYFVASSKTEAFTSFKLLNNSTQIIILVLSIFGGIIFFATLLNLYNSINYSVEARSNYLGMMRAIGAQKKMLPRLYLVEIILIFVKAIPWAVILSAGISYGIKYSVDSMFKYGQEIIGTAITLSFNYYFVALGIVLIFIFLIGLLFSFIACRPVTKNNILDVLTTDK